MYIFKTGDEESYEILVGFIKTFIIEEHTCCSNGKNIDSNSTIIQPHKCLVRRSLKTVSRIRTKINLA